MTSRRDSSMPKEGEGIPVSLLAIERREEMLWTAAKAVPEECFPPCIKNIIKTPRSKATSEGGEKGRHRMAAILAAFLGQAGWDEDEARKLWSDTAGYGVKERIFDEWFQEMNCPKCETLQRESRGYPELGVADLEICQPDERCSDFEGPVEQAAGLRREEDRSQGRQKHIKTRYMARIFDWSAGREGEIDLSEAEKNELEGLISKQTSDGVLIYTRARVRGRLRPRFSLMEAKGPRRRVLSEFL